MHPPTAMGKAAQKAFFVCSRCSDSHGGLATKETKIFLLGALTAIQSLGWAQDRSHGSHQPDSTDHGPSPAAFPAVTRSARPAGSPWGNPRLQLPAWRSCGGGGAPVAPAAALAAGEEEPEPGLSQLGPRRQRLRGARPWLRPRRAAGECCECCAPPVSLQPTPCSRRSDRRCERRTGLAGRRLLPELLGIFLWKMMVWVF